MADLPTRLDLMAIGRSYVVQHATKIDPAMIDVDGSDVNIIVGSQSVMCDAIIKQLAYQTNRIFLDGCFGDDLDRYAFDRYTLLRKGASPAVGAVRFSRPSAAAGGGSLPIGTQLKTDTGVAYITTEVATFATSQVDNVLANVRAVQAGKATQAAKGQLKKFQQLGSIFDKTIVVTNDLATAGGEDVEDDDTFKDRVRDFWATARRGVIGAIEFGAKTVPGVVSAMAVEALTPTGLPARVVQLYIADSSGVASQALADKVAAALLEYRAGGIAVIIFTSLPLIAQVQLKLSFAAGAESKAVTSLVLAAVVDFVNTLPVNGPLLVADVYSVLKRFTADGLVATKDSITLPAGDLYPDIGTTLRTTPENVLAVN